MELRDAMAAERGQIVTLLARSGLPVSDLDASDVEFIVAVEDEVVLGAVGVEPHGSAALLRSLCVSERARGIGLGGRLVAAIEARAVERRIGDLVLLTTTARDFFARRGYVEIRREDAPEAVRQSAEFRSLCPASSSCMTRRIGVP